MNRPKPILNWSRPISNRPRPIQMRSRPILKRSRVIWFRPGLISNWPGIIHNWSRLIWNDPRCFRALWQGCRAAASPPGAERRSERMWQDVCFGNLFLSPDAALGDGDGAARQSTTNYSTLKIFAVCFVPPKVSCGWSPDFLPMSCSPSGDCGVMTRISLLSCKISVPPARGPMK